MVELLSPVGSFESLKAAVQNGADSVYFGSGKFNARAFASNFDKEALKQAISYAKLRNVKTHLTLNTLLKKEEIPEALKIAQAAISYGVDAIIVQDLGLASLLKKYFPDTPLHASTQMTIHNLEGVRELEKIGFSRVVLARELSLNEIEFITTNTNLEIETFIHGALCISYSGQCLFSSMIGGRSGNRGTCAQPCRLPYELYEKKGEIIEGKKLDQGYLLSPRDLCGLELIPDLIHAGVQSFKIEGRMKSPEYVATVTRIYRKYIDLALSEKPYTIDDSDRKELLQIFNRGDFSKGHFSNSPNQNLVFSKKPNHLGLYLGNITYLNPAKGLITLKTKEPIKIGDQIAFEKEEHRYTISEITLHGKTVKEALAGQEVTIGRMKGNLHLGDRIYQSSSKDLMDKAKSSYAHVTEQKKIPLSASITIKQGNPIVLQIKSVNTSPALYQNVNIAVTSSEPFPEEAQKKPLTIERVKEQLSKTTNTPYEFTDIQVQLDDNTFLPNVKVINELRREALNQLEDTILSSNSIATKELPTEETIYSSCIKPFHKAAAKKTKSISMLLNYLHPEFDYGKLSDIDSLYLPLRFFAAHKYEKELNLLCNKFNCYLYLPTIVKPNFINLTTHTIEEAINQYSIKGIVLSNMSHFNLIRTLNLPKTLNYVANYTTNSLNPYSIQLLQELGASKVILSPELSEKDFKELITSSPIPTELMVYGNTPLMTSNYCLLGKSNKCYPTCQAFCQNGKSYYLKDRKGFLFRVVPDNVQTVTTIYNSKITSIKSSLFEADSFRIDILDETIEDMLAIISTVKNGERLEGSNYTNGNLNRNI